MRQARRSDQRFFDAVSERRVPVELEHLGKLQRSPRRMDPVLLAFLSYTVYSVRRSVKIKLADLRPIFASDIEETFHFKNRLKSDLKGISAVYPDFRIAIDHDMLVLEKSPPPVPRLSGILCAGASMTPLGSGLRT